MNRNLRRLLRGGIPPRKIAGVGFLDPPVNPKRQPGPLPHVPASPLARIFVTVILVAIALVSIDLLLLAVR
jgi:hypothetical protein